VPSSGSLKRITLILFAFLWLAPFVLAQRGEIVEDIQIRGNRKIPGETVRGRMFTRSGDVFDPASIERDFNALWNAGYFEDIRIEREQGEKGVLLIVYVKEKPTIRSIEYKGLSSVSQSDVLERFKAAKVGLSQESPYDPTKAKRAEVVLKELLAENGRQFATITTEIRPIPPASVGVTFNIKEGPKVKVGKINFEGNKEVSDRALRSAMKNLKPIGIPRSIFLENLFSRTFDSTKLQEDAERVRDALQQRGFFKAIVGDPQTQMKDTSGTFLNPFAFRKAGKKVDITMPIEEGEKFKLGSITFKGGKAVTNMKALRSLFPMKDGAVFNTADVRKGLDNLRKAYGELGYINFTPVPDTKINEDTKTVDLEIDLDEGKSYSVRRIEFTGNTTTRDKVIRRELALDEGSVYNSRLWEISLLRLNQLQYFESIDKDKDTEIRRNDTEATIDLTLKVKEKGKNSIGFTGGVSGLAGSFVGINYETNNFLGLGETLRVEFNVGSRERNIMFGFTEPYLFDRPLQFGFTVFSRRYDFNAARELAIRSNQDVNLPSELLDQFQNYRQSSTGFTTSLSYPIRRSFKRVSLTYAFDTSSVETFSGASQRLFEQIAFRNISGPNALKGVVTSKFFPSFSWNTIGNPQTPHSGFSLFVGGDISGIGGNVAALRPIVEWKHFIPMNKWRPTGDPSEGRQTFGYRLQGSFITGYRGLVANPSERAYTGGDNDIRGFDIRSISPYSFLADQTFIRLVNPDAPCLLTGTCEQVQGSGIPKDPSNPLRGSVDVALPAARIVAPGGDTNLIGNFEYRVPVVGPVTIAAFFDVGMNFIARESQLRLTDAQLNTLNTQPFGCRLPLDANFNCTGTQTLSFDQVLKPAPGTNFVPRASTGLELQVILPILNAPFRIYYAYNPLILDTTIGSPTRITREMFPDGAIGDFNFARAQQLLMPNYRLKEPRKTFRFTVATTF
jgi:outer membrane protein insertion porin family